MFGCRGPHGEELKLFGFSVAKSLVQEIHELEVTTAVHKTISIKGQHHVVMITLNVQTWLAQHRSQGLFSSSQVKEGSQRENPGTRLWLLKLRIQKFSFLVFCFTVFFLNLEQNLKRDLLKHFKAGRKIVYRSREYYFVVDGTRKNCHATR